MWLWQQKDWQIRFKGTGDEVISTFVKFSAGESVGVIFVVFLVSHESRHD